MTAGTEVASQATYSSQLPAAVREDDEGAAFHIKTGARAFVVSHHAIRGQRIVCAMHNIHPIK